MWFLVMQPAKWPIKDGHQSWLGQRLPQVPSTLIEVSIFQSSTCSVLTNNLYLSLFAWVNLYVRLPPPTNQKNFTQYLCETWIALVNLKVISTSRCRTPYLQHLEGTSNNPDIFKGINRFWLGFTMVVYEKMYLGE